MNPPTSAATLRFGIHDFLNSRPLIEPLRAQSAEADWRIVTGVPSLLAEQLEAGELDLAFIPSFEYLRHAGSYRLVPDIGISSRGPVRTVLLATKAPLKRCGTIAVDHRSRTSVRLMQWLYGGEFPAVVEYLPMPPKPAIMLGQADAALIIGDEALAFQPEPGQRVYDLGEEWFKRTGGKTFVHAVLAVRESVRPAPRQLEYIRAAKLESSKHIPAVAKQHAATQGLDENLCRDYLTRNIIYHLGAEEMEGLQLFRDECRKKEWLAASPPFQWAG